MKGLCGPQVQSFSLQAEGHIPTKHLAPAKASKLVQTERDGCETEDASFSFSLGSG